MKSVLRCLLPSLAFAFLGASAFSSAPPALVVVISIDQFRADYLVWFRAQFGSMA